MFLHKKTRAVLERLLFGPVSFSEEEGFAQFQYRVLCALLICGSGLAGLYVLSVIVGLCLADPIYFKATSAYLVVTVALLVAVRGRKEWLIPVAWGHEITSFSLFGAAFLLNVSDELRIIWFCLNLSGVYLMLGSRVGVVVTALTIGFIVLANRWIAVPYSTNAVVTAAMTTTYISAFFHFYGNRSLAFFKAMQQSNQMLVEVANQDPLTGVMNARAYYLYCDRLIQAAQQNGTPFCALFVDLDFFKRINDQYGHEAGDGILTNISNCLSKQIRSSDVLGRIGGEEFSIFLPETDLLAAIHLAERIRAAIEALENPLASNIIPVTASIGVAASRPAYNCTADIQRVADQAMYQAKQQGRNRVVSFT